MELDLGRNGAKVQSWRENNPRAILRQMLDASPGASDEELLQKLGEKLSDKEWDVVLEYWFSNNVRSIRHEGVGKREVAVARTELAFKNASAQLEEKIQEKAKIKLMEMLLPSGTMLKDSTGNDCEKAGGWFKKIAAKVGADEIVGQKLSENQLRALL